MQKMKTSIIIVTYNAENYIKNCLNSILKQNNKNFDVIIVDNNSKDKTLEIINNFQKKSKKIYLLKNNENLGFSKSNNIGIKFAIEKQSDYFLLLNQDTVVDKNLIKTGEKYFKTIKDAGAFSPKILIKDNKKIWWIGTKVFTLSDLFKNLKLGVSIHIDKEKEDYPIKEPIEVEAVSGCSLFIKKEITDKVGLLDEDFFMYGEDLDYSLRIKDSKYKLYVIPETVVLHDVGLEGFNLKKNFKKYKVYIKSSLQVINKDFSLLYQIVWILRLPFSLIYEMFRRLKWKT